MTNIDDVEGKEEEGDGDRVNYDDFDDEHDDVDNDNNNDDDNELDNHNEC